MRKLTRVADAVLLAVLCLPAAAAAQTSAVDPCVVEDDGTGTVQLPPPGCAYLSPMEVHMIIDGLPPGTTIELDPIHLAFFCRDPQDNAPCIIEPGGAFGEGGGQREVFDSFLIFEMRGTGDLDGFHRILSIPTQAETHTDLRIPGQPIQDFATDMFLIQGALPPGDPDFAVLQVQGGTGNGFPSPGHTTLTSLGDGTFNVDSFFDITYQITFQGAPGGALDGLSGTTTGTVEVRAFGQKDRCVGDDIGTVPSPVGTTELPPPDCDYISPQEVHEMIAGLPPGTTIELSPRHRDFICTNPGPDGVCGQPGGGLGGEVELFDSTLVLQLEGTGTLDGFYRTLRVPLAVETHTGPRTPGDPAQDFDTEMVSLQGAIFGDPDFDELTITGGTGNGLPSPGHTTLFDNGDGTFNIDSFFDITYQIDFVGAPGGVLDGLSGSTQATLRMEARESKAESIEPGFDGAVELPPMGSAYLSPQEVHMIIAGLPPGTTIELGPIHMSFFCTQPGGVCGVPGGTLGGNKEEFDSVIELEMTGTGSLVGFKRTLQVPLAAETHTGPRLPASGSTLIESEMFKLQGTLPTDVTPDPDFDSLLIIAGTNNALPSPGHTTLTDLGDGTFVVDSFFDITYQINFVGEPGGALDGLSGSTLRTLRMTACDDPDCPSIVVVGDKTVSSPETIQSRGLLTANGVLRVGEDTAVEARRLLVLDNGFEAQVAAGKTLTLGINTGIPCPISP